MLTRDLLNKGGLWLPGQRVSFRLRQVE